MFFPGSQANSVISVPDAQNMASVGWPRMVSQKACHCMGSQNAPYLIILIHFSDHIPQYVTWF